MRAHAGLTPRSRLTLVDRVRAGRPVADVAAEMGVSTATPVTLVPPSDPEHVSSFPNTRVADIAAVCEQWRARGAEFLTPPIDRGMEVRWCRRDPDGYLIEGGQLVGRPGG
jgi:hypothetical protein